METEVTVGKLNATRRTATGKGVARKLRAQGLVPGVVYGKKEGSIPLAFKPDALRKSLDPKKKENTLLQLVVQDGDKQDQYQVMVKDYHLHSLRGDLLHTDFHCVTDETPVNVSVPFQLTGKPVGVKTGGELKQVFRDLPITCQAAKIPGAVVLDVTPMKVGDTLRVKDLIDLGETVAVRLPPGQALAQVMAAKKEEVVVAEGEAAEGEGGAAAEGAAPAEGAK